MQLHFALEGRLDLALDLVAAEQRNRVVVELYAALVRRHDRIDELVRLVVGFLAVDEDFAYVAPQAVADRADNDVVLLVQESRRLVFFAGVGNRLVELQQVLEVPRQLLAAAVDAGGAHDHAHAVRDFEGR